MNILSFDCRGKIHYEIINIYTVKDIKLRILIQDSKDILIYLLDTSDYDDNCSLDSKNSRRSR